MNIKQKTKEVNKRFKYKRVLKATFKFDSTTLSLLLSNIISIGQAVYYNYDILFLAWIFFVQNITIGLFHFIRLLKLKNFNNDSLKFEDKIVSLNKNANIETAFIFAIPYYFLHFVGLLVLIVISISKDLPILWVIISSSLFIINHYLSFRKDVEKDRENKQSLTKQLIFPFIRVIPMSIIVIIGIISSGIGVLLIGICKAVTDIFIHQYNKNYNLVELEDYVSGKEVEKTIDGKNG